MHTPSACLYALPSSFALEPSFVKIMTTSFEESETENGLTTWVPNLFQLNSGATPDYEKFTGVAAASDGDYYV